MEYCEIFSHHIMFICAFTAWVKGPSILSDFILKRCHGFIIIVVARRSIIFIEHFLWRLITVNHSRTNFHLCQTGSQHVMSKWAHFHIWAMRLTLWAIDSIQPAMVVGRLDQMSLHVVTFWVLSLAFWKKLSGDGHNWLLSPCCYTTCMWAVLTCNRQILGAIPSHLDAQKHLDDLLHSAGKASSLFSGLGLSCDHSQHTHGGLLELDIHKIEMGTTVVINNLWSILNNTTANIDIALTRCSFFYRLTYIYASRIVPASRTKFHDNFTKVMGMVKKYKEDIIYMNQDLGCVLWYPRCQIYEHISGPSLWRWCWCLHSTFSPHLSPLWRYHGTPMLVAGTPGDA